MKYMKDAIETLLTRRSIKKYNGKPIPEDVLNKILEVGTYAPTAKNMQKPIIIVIQDKKVRAEIAEENAKIMGMKDLTRFTARPSFCLLRRRIAPRRFTTAVALSIICLTRLGLWA